MNKYNNKKIKGYDSKKEYIRSLELKSLQSKGIISELREQVKFVLLPSQYDIVNGKKVCIERACSYIADFVYIKNGKQIVEDVKGMRTDVYKIKKKLMFHFHKIRITEI